MNRSEVICDDECSGENVTLKAGTEPAISQGPKDEGYSESLLSPSSIMTLNNQQKYEIVLSLLESLPSKYRQMIAMKMHDAGSKDFVSSLPVEIAIEILSYLDYKDICSCMEVSKSWFKVLQDESLWKNLISRIPLSIRYNRFKKAVQETETDMPDNDVLNWKFLSKNAYILNDNWTKAKYHRMELRGHDDAVYTAQQDDKHIISGSRDHTVKIWDIKTGICLATFVAHDKSVLCLQFDENEIVSGSSDASIKIWDRRTLQLKNVLKSHSDSVLNLRMDENYIVSGSRDRLIKVWNRRSGKLLRTLVGHASAVNAIAFKNNLIVSGSGDRLIKVWDFETGEILRNLVGHNRGVACLHFDGYTIISGASDEKIRIWDVHTGECKKILVGHSGLIRALHFDDRYIVSGSYDETIIIWDKITGQRLHTLSHGHQAHILGVRLDQKRIVSAGMDKKIVLWNFTAGAVDERFFGSDDDMDPEMLEFQYNMALSAKYKDPPDFQRT